MKINFSDLKVSWKIEIELRAKESLTSSEKFSFEVQN